MLKAKNIFFFIWMVVLTVLQVRVMTATSVAPDGQPVQPAGYPADIQVPNDQDGGQITFADSTGAYDNITMRSGLSDELRIRNLVPGGNGGIRFIIELLSGSRPSLNYLEDPAHPDVSQFDMGMGPLGGKITLGGSVVIQGRGPQDGVTYLHLDPGTTPPNPVAGEANIYFAGSLLVVQYNDGGEIVYKYLDLAGTSTEWQYSNVAP